MDRHTRRLTSQLCKAVNEGDPRSVQQLLLQGANPNLVGTKGVAAVHLSVGKETEKNIRCLKTLLQYGADPNIRSSEGLTPLHVAALWGCYQNLKLLLMNGGNPYIKDNEGNTPQQLAEQQENRKCAHLLQEYQAGPTDTEEDDIPQFQYSPLSSTRRSSFFNLSNINGRLSCRSVSHHRPSYPSILSSTRMSAVEPAAAVSNLKEDGNCTDDTTSKGEECTASPDVSFMRASQKSVSFRDDVDEYYPVFSPESPQQNPAVDGCQRSLPFDISEYSDFLDSERMATILHKQGIDATSPDHVYIFCRESSESTEEDLEKTVLVHCALEESDDEQETERVKDTQGNSDENKVHCHAAGSSSGTSSSHYSSCEIQGCGGNDVDSPSKEDVVESAAVEEKSDHPFTPSPFVTGRTRSRMSRCSLRTSRTESLSTSLFEDTLPTPVRIRRQTPRSPTSEEFYNSPRLPSSAHCFSGRPTEGGCLSQVESLNNEDAWITRDCSSLPDSVSSSSTSSYGSPRRSKEDSDFPCTPGTGCTPRYSMSRLSSCRRPQHLANLSYTPGGRPHIQDVDEPVEYLYTDTERGHKLIETHVPPTETILYDWRTLHCVDNILPEIRGITDKELRSRLVELGESPGPISSRTRPTYMRRLCRLVQESNYAGYSPELCRVLETFNLPNCQADEQALCQQFDQPDQNRKWREGIIKSSFNYLLLDPRVTKNLPFRSHTMTPKECFQTFIHAIFYVGKGKRSRPYSHLYEALEYFKGDKTSKKLCSKVQHILQVWNTGQGVISLHCFQNVIPVEAYTREACMVEAIGLKMLTNQKRGDFYGIVSNWQTKKKRELGIHLLYRAMQIFLAEGERQLRPADIRQ
uniref:Ankyrin repeat and LEM domain containing 1 n=1 Tax=Pundamilia nyererei TaxID=303518 RepID=A0A3B4GYZ9_9CICH